MTAADLGWTYGGGFGPEDDPMYKLKTLLTSKEQKRGYEMRPMRTEFAELARISAALRKERRELVQKSGVLRETREEGVGLLVLCRWKEFGCGNRLARRLALLHRDLEPRRRLGQREHVHHLGRDLGHRRRAAHEALPRAAGPFEHGAQVRVRVEHPRHDVEQLALVHPEAEGRAHLVWRAAQGHVKAHCRSASSPRRLRSDFADQCDRRADESVC